MYNQSVRNILTPNINGFSGNILVLQDILQTAKQEQKNRAAKILDFLCKVGK